MTTLNGARFLNGEGSMSVTAPKFCELERASAGRVRLLRLDLSRPTATGDPIVIDLGRHMNDHMVSFYMANPSGYALEYGWGSRPSTTTHGRSNTTPPSIVCGATPSSEAWSRGRRHSNRRHRDAAQYECGENSGAVAVLWATSKVIPGWVTWAGRTARRGRVGG